MSILSFVLYLLVAAVCAYLAKKYVPSAVSRSFNVSIILGTIGAWIGSSMLGSYGPDFYGVSLLPSILGSTVLIFALSPLTKLLHKIS